MTERRGGTGRAWLPMTLVMIGAACYTPRRQAPVPMPLRLVSAEPFTLELEATVSAPATTCQVRRADLDVRALSGDTIRFSAVRAIQVAPMQPVCNQSGAGFVVTSKHPSLKAVRVEVNTARTWFTILVAVPVVYGVLVLTAFALFAGN